jgi:hypothetical protein
VQMSDSKKRPHSPDPEEEKRADTEEEKSADPKEENNVEKSVTFRWLDEGNAGPDGRIMHEGIQLTVNNETFHVKCNDTVNLWSSGDEDTTWEASWVARIEGLWEGADFPCCRARWFYTQEQILAFSGKLVVEGDFQASTDYVLSDHSDENDVGCIQRLFPINFLAPDDPREQSSSCRYTVVTESGGKTWRVSPWSPGDDDEDNDSLSVSDDSSTSSGNRVMRTEGEGSALRGDIQVGEMHQVPVDPFKGPQTVTSRNPKLVWKAKRDLTEEDLQAFLHKLAETHTPFLKERGLTMDEPYSPLRTDDEEELMKQMPGYRSVTGSSASSASSLSQQRNKLLKECNVDAVLEILHDHNYDTEAALADIRANHNKITTIWNQSEKKIFDDGFRTSEGSLRSISKTMVTKEHKDVVDYWFRFKIPDQFRLVSLYGIFVS